MRVLVALALSACTAAGSRATEQGHLILERAPEPEPAIDGCATSRPERTRVQVLDRGSPPYRVLRHDAASGRFVLAGEMDGTRLRVALEPVAAHCFRYRAEQIGERTADTTKERFPFGVVLVRPRGELFYDPGDHDHPADGAQAMNEYGLEVVTLQVLTWPWLPLPEEPVGIGARWSASRTDGRDRLTFHEMHWLTLERADDDGIEVAVDIESIAPPQFEYGANYYGEELVEQHEHMRGRWMLRRGDPLPSAVLHGSYERRRGQKLSWELRSEWERTDEPASALLAAYRKHIAEHGIGPVEMAGESRWSFRVAPAP